MTPMLIRVVLSIALKQMGGHYLIVGETLKQIRQRGIKPEIAASSSGIPTLSVASQISLGQIRRTNPLGTSPADAPRRSKKG